MSVMIKGVEMPSKCWSCPCCVDNGLIGRDREYFCSALDSDFEIDNLEQRLSACPLKEVPTLHGRLIDADILLDTIRYGAEGRAICDKCKFQDCQNCVIESVYKIIREAITVIEAEVSE